MKKLNGWQRLWMVLSIFLLVVTLLGVLDDLPKQDTIIYNWANDTIAETIDSRDLFAPTVGQVRDLYGDSSDEEIIIKIQTRFSDIDQEKINLPNRFVLDELPDRAKTETIDFGPVNKKYQDQLQSLTVKQTKLLAEYFGGWFLLVMVLYLLGWSVGWIVRGFKQDHR